jgi:Cu(I)/Ag(I) efflux system membrane fusion protein
MTAIAKRGPSVVLLLLALGAWAVDDPNAGSGAAIRLDAEQQRLAGVTYGTAERRALEKVIRTVGRVDVDERKLTAVTLKVGGYIEDLFADYTGKLVRKGEPLFTIYSPDLVSAEQEYLTARDARAALAQTKMPQAAESAASLLRASRERLRLWGLSEPQIRAVEEAGKPSLHRTIASPASGVILEKMIIAGQRVEAGAMLYRIADLSTIWVYGDVYEYELPFVKVGQPASIRLASSPNRVFAACVASIHPTLDAKTRTVKVRFELDNRDLFLKPEMYGSVELRVPRGERLVVPTTAVLDSGRRQLVFVASGDGRLTPREVELGERADDYVEILRGLEAGERVVTSANFLVDSESQLQGAGSMMEMMGAIGMGDRKMESARPMTMGGQKAGDREGAAYEKPRAASSDEKPIGDLRVAVFPVGQRATVGESAVRVRIRDASGAPVERAKVRFDYTMDMPGMAVGSAEAAEIGDGVYEGTAKFPMAGPWGLVVEIGRPGKPSLRGRFTLRVSG